MNQQRSRRFRAAQEAKEKDEENQKEFLKMLKSKGSKHVDQMETELANKKTWDSNAITPGTPFMETLAASLRYWVAYKLNTDPAWENLKIIISDATVPGEGEHKIMEFIRSQRGSPDHDPNTRHVLYGLDADLIMLGLATHEPHFRVLREDVFFQAGKGNGNGCHKCGETGHKAAECRKPMEIDKKDMPEKPFIWLHVAILREYLAVEMRVPNQPFKFELERALDDWVFMCFFVGNDFLPHLPSLDIREEGIDILIAIWRDNIPRMGGYVTKDGHVDLQKVQYILTGLAKQEDAIFKRRKQVDDRKNRNAKRRQQEQDDRNAQNQRHGKRPKMPKDWAPDASEVELKSLSEPRKDAIQTSKKDMEITHDMVMNRDTGQAANQANKSAAAVLKERLTGNKSNGTSDVSPASQVTETPGVASEQTTTSPSALGKRKAEDITPNDQANQTAAEDDAPGDEVRLWEAGYADRYYESKFGVDASDREFRHKVAAAYVEGLSWVLLYYFQGCPSWTWYYPYHYAPFAEDFVELSSMKITFDQGKPFKPFEQLMGVLPAASNHAIPPLFRDLMTNENSDIVDFYPEDFKVDLNGKKFAWQGVAILPFIDEKRLLKAMHDLYPEMTEDERRRNDMGREALLFSDRHPLYETVAAQFYSKKKAGSSLSLDAKESRGLIGEVEKNLDYLPQGTLSFPGEEDKMPDIEDDRSISVHYELPKKNGLHKSVILPGVKPPDPVLMPEDIEATKAKAMRSGRSFGGAPLHGDRGRGRGRGRGGPPVHYGDHSNMNQNPNNNRPNPFAAHINPQYFSNGPSPPQMGRGWGPPPPPGAMHGQAPPFQPMQGVGGFMPPQMGMNMPRDPYSRPPMPPQGFNQGGSGHRGGNHGRGRGRGGDRRGGRY